MLPSAFVECVPSSWPADQIVRHDTGDRHPHGALAHVTLFLPPYMGDGADLALMTRMPSLRAVQTLTAGVDNVWPHLPVTASLHNAAHVHDASTAELAMALMLASLRRLDDFARSGGDWRFGTYDALADRRVLIIGYGGIGQALERRLAGFEVDITRVARTRRVLPDGAVVHGIDELPALLPLADVVVLAVPHTVQTRGLVDAEFLALMPTGSLLVNVARGPIVVTDDLLQAVSTGRVKVALDVTDPEPLPSTHPLWSLPGVLISPHVGGNTTAFLPRARRLVSDQLRRWMAGVPLAYEVARPTS